MAAKIDEALVEKLKDHIRVKNSSSVVEIADLAAACLHDLDIAGVHANSTRDPLVFQAIRLYIKAHYGYDDDTDRFLNAYSNLRDSMSLSGDYAGEEEENG